MDVLRTPDDRFADLHGWAFAAHHVEVGGLRMHHIDEGPAAGPVMLLLHGEPSWSYLYRRWVDPLVTAGFQVVAVDAIGFGRSDKVTDPGWYSLDRHIGQLVGFVEALDLRDVSLVVQDWAGPIGLCSATDLDERISRLVILNTWLHHDGYHYTQALHDWHEMAARPGLPFGRVVGTEAASCSPDPAEELHRAYSAPFPDDCSVAGAVAWPAMLPFVDPVRGGAERQERTLRWLGDWDRPAHVLFGDRDRIFTAEWGERFAAMIPGATFDVVPGGTHFVQEVGEPAARQVLARIAEEDAVPPSPS